MRPRCDKRAKRASFERRRAPRDRPSSPPRTREHTPRRCARAPRRSCRRRRRPRSGHWAGASRDRDRRRRARVAPRSARRAAPPLPFARGGARRFVGAHVEDDGEVGARAEAVERADPLDRVAAAAAAGDALVGEARGVVAIGEHHAAVRDPRLDLRLDVVHAIGGEQQSHRRPVRRAAPRHDDPPGEDLAHERADRPVARLARLPHELLLRAQAVGEARHVRRRPRPVDPLEHHESSARLHLGPGDSPARRARHLDRRRRPGSGSSPRTTLSMRRVPPIRQAIATSARSPTFAPSGAGASESASVTST